MKEASPHDYSCFLYIWCTLGKSFSHGGKHLLKFNKVAISDAINRNNIVYAIDKIEKKKKAEIINNEISGPAASRGFFPRMV